MTNQRISRNVTCKLLDMMDEGAIEPRALVEVCLNWMSEDDVAEMAKRNDLFESEEEDEE
jgi:hypothetical protein